MNGKPEETIKATTDAVQKAEDLVTRLTDAGKALEIFRTTYKADWDKWLADSGHILPEMRAFQMAMGTETIKLLAHFADIRKFFLNEEHEREVRRLEHFVDLCERLKKLKDEGFLDRVTDTILKLGVPQ